MRWQRLSCLILVALVIASHQRADAYEAKYSGRRLDVSIWGTLTCRADRAAGTGYYRTAQGWVVSSSYDRQSTTATWIIKFAGENARVTDGQGNVGDYIVTKRDSSGFILVEATPNVSVQIISIDPTTASFVYTTQNAQPLWNRASTFTGHCE